MGIAGLVVSLKGNYPMMLVMLWNPSPCRSAHRTACTVERSTFSVTRHFTQYASDGDFTNLPFTLNSRQWMQRRQ